MPEHHNTVPPEHHNTVPPELRALEARSDALVDAGHETPEEAAESDAFEARVMGIPQRECPTCGAEFGRNQRRCGDCGERL